MKLTRNFLGVICGKAGEISLTKNDLGLDKAGKGITKDGPSLRPLGRPLFSVSAAEGPMSIGQRELKK